MKFRSIFALGFTLITAAVTLSPTTISPAEQKMRRVAPIGRLPGFEERKREADAQREAVESGPLAFRAEEETAPAPTPRAPSVITEFPGMDASVNAPSVSVPPDTHAATGPNHIVQVVNSAIAVFNRTTGALAPSFPQLLSDFFASIKISDCIFDPVVVYDELANRFVVAALDVPAACENPPVSNTGRLLYAVSNSSDPTDDFDEMHAIDADEPAQGSCMGTVMADFPRAGWNADAHVFTLNMFNFTTECFDHVTVITIDKSTVLDVNAGTFAFVHADRDDSHFTLAPATMHGSSPGDSMWFVEAKDFGGGNQIRVTRMTSILTTPIFTETNVTVASYGFPPSAPQQGGGNTIDTNDTRILNAEWRDNRLVAAHTVGLSGTARARWYEFDTSGGSPTLTQQGTISPGAEVHTYYPSIAIAPNGDLGMTFMQSSSSEFMSMYVTGQLAGDPPGTMQTPVLAKAGDANYSAFDCLDPGDTCRAGDYSGITIDPNFTDRFCAANEYATSDSDDNWGTWITCFSLTSDHDFAVTKMSAPKSLKGAGPVDGAVKVTIQNRSAHNETIPDASVLGDGTTTGLVRLSVSVVDAGGESCLPVLVNLDVVKNAKLFAKGPRVLKPGKSVTVNYLVTYECSTPLPKADTAGDYSHTATVHHEALSGGDADTHTDDDSCPRAVLPGGIDANPPPKGTKDKGCGRKKSPGVPILTNVVQ